MEEIRVKVLSFNQLFADAQAPVALDSYQRPYVWNEEKTRQLVSDLKEYTEKGGEQPPYYMGTILLHNSVDKKKLFIIDGQQRLTTLSVLYNELHDQLPVNSELTYNSKLSVLNILNNRKSLRQSGLHHSIFDRICFTVITVNSEDLAFTFFDTQNNRGVPLAPTDLLKAYHLRAIGSANNLALQLQTYSAQRWETIQNLHRERRTGNDFVQMLFDTYLWKSRNWRGKRVKIQESHDDILHTFQTESLSQTNVSDIPLYAGANNKWAESIRITDKNSFSVTLKPVSLEGDASSLPFSLRQPIHDGVGFFLYTQKYAQLLFDMQNKETLKKDSELDRFHTFYKEVVEWSGLVGYLRRLFWLASLVYVDQFGHKKLTEFAEALNYSIGAIRIEKKSVQKETPVKYLRDRDVNFLDCIASAYRPEEVIEHLMKDPIAKGIYANSYNISSLKPERVQHRYLTAVQNYYGGRSDWDKRDQWRRA